MKCKQYSEIIAEIRTQLKTVKITSNIFAVHCKALLEDFCNDSTRVGVNLRLKVNSPYFKFNQCCNAKIQQNPIRLL